MFYHFGKNRIFFDEMLLTSQNSQRFLSAVHLCQTSRQLGLFVLLGQLWVSYLVICVGFCILSTHCKIFVFTVYPDIQIH